ncbi:MAG: hypothetical protein M3245_05620 [Actinomycetota bacterium]|nr:hypothetical protein [Actinomycetota bacterium]
MSRILRRGLIVPLGLLMTAQAAMAAPGDCRLIAGADTPDDPTDDVEVCELQTYFHRAGSAVANTGSGGYPTFNDQAPTQTSAAAYVTVLGRVLAYSPQYRPTFTGTFTGNIDTLRVDSYVSSPVYQGVGIGYPLIFELTIDDAPVVLENPAAGSERDIPMAPTGETGVGRMSFGISNLYEAMKRNGIQTGPDTQHTVRIWMTALYYGDGNSVHWFDSVSRPGGIYFNPSDLTGLEVYDAGAY